MKTVEIKGVKATACHGVLQEEKTNPQEFEIDIGFDYDLFVAAQGDDISGVVNYAEVAEEAYELCTQNSFDLIETLAYEIAFLLMKRFALMKSVRVTVHKPYAPINLPFDDICVTAELERVKTVLSLGSNLGDRRATLEGAIAALKSTRGIKVEKVSDFIATPPYGGAAHGEFLNCALVAECLLPAQELLKQIHRIEEEFGRVREERWGDRTLDIDIIFFGNKIIAEDGLIVPHADYKNRSFVLYPIKQIAPDFVCPVSRKRVGDM